MTTGILTKSTNANNSVNQQSSQAPNGITATSVSFLAGRVKNIILDESSEGFFDFGRYNGIGTIQFQNITNPTAQLTVAKPFFPNFKNFPLLEEIVWIIQLPSTSINGAAPDKPGISTNVNNYYLNPTALWNHPHHNGFPSNPSAPLESQRRDYIQTSIGNVRRVTDQSTELDLGKTFIERPNIHPLKPFEGDIIYEGRWGNSIRFGSTIKTKENQIPLNIWSEGTSTSGDPILIIRNGQGTQTNEGWIPIEEEINNDEASIYFTSTQKIPLKASSISYLSYKDNPPQTPDQYTGKQIIINSGRLVFNTTSDHILLSSNKSINLNAKESVNIDSPNITIQSGEVYLGSKNATEPVLLGDSTISTLNNLINNLSEFFQVCSKVIIKSAPGALTPLNIAADELSIQLKVIQGNLEKLKSNTVKTV